MFDRWNRVALVGALVCSGAMIAGCEPERDELSAAIAQAEAELAAIHAGSGHAAPSEVRADAYNKVVSSLRGKQSSGSDDAKGAAGLVMSEAQRGLAELAAARARRADSQIAYMMGRAASELSVYRKQTNLADALAAYDPSDDIASFESRIADVSEEIEALSAQIADLESQRDDKRAFVAARLAEARESRAKASDVQRRLIDASADTRVALATEAAQYQRTADLLERQGAMAEIEASEFDPMIEGVRRQIQLLRGRRSALEQGIEQARSTASAKREQASEARREANRAGSAVSDSIDEIISLFEGEVAQAYDEALAFLDEASSNAARARGAREAKQAADGATAHAEASVRLEYAQVANRLAGFIDEASGSPSPSGAGSHRGKVRDLRDKAQEMLDAAGEAYSTAESAFSGLRVKDQFTQGQLETLGERLRTVGAALRGDELSTEEDAGAIEEAPE